MWTLALDTTTRPGSVALLCDGRLIEEAPGDPASSAVEHLPGDLMGLLARHGLTTPELDVLAVAVGPGSFTGLRVGIATMQGLSFAAGLPLVGVSGLDALAALAGGGLVATWVDAWRGEVFAARYHDGVVDGEPTVDTPAALLANLPADVPVTFMGDGAVAYRAAIEMACGTRGRFPVQVAPLIAGSVARLAEAVVRAGGRPGPEAVAPLYVRRPDVELARSRTRGLGQ